MHAVHGVCQCVDKATEILLAMAVVYGMRMTNNDVMGLSIPSQLSFFLTMEICTRARTSMTGAQGWMNKSVHALTRVYLLFVQQFYFCLICISKHCCVNCA